MGKPRPARSVKLLVGLLGSDPDLLRRARQLLVRRFGPVDCESDFWPFDQTDYYQDEMGPRLQRWFLGFAEPIPPDRLAEIKHETNAIEEAMAADCALLDIPRPVNIDPGYIDLTRLVLATTKDRGHRIYLGHGIYAEVTLLYAQGAWQVLPWTYPDYRRAEYHVFFSRLRERLHQQQHEGAS
jgi:hypothetical protein